MEKGVEGGQKKERAALRTSSGWKAEVDGDGTEGKECHATTLDLRVDYILLFALVPRALLE